MKKLILLFLLLAFSSQGCREKNADLPSLNADLPSLQDQIKLYQNIYRNYNHDNFDPKTTHIQEYEQLLPIAIAYTRSKIPTEKEALLLKFWEEAKEDLANKQMTIARYKRTIMRLALLVASSQERGALYYASGLYRSLQNNFANNDYSLDYDADALRSGFLMNRDTLDAHPFPFCFEAILFHPEGKFSLDDYLSSLLDPNLSLSLSVFPSSSEGPHNDMLKNSAEYLFHDLTHWALFVENRGNTEWPRIKEVLGDFYRGTIRELDKRVLFILTHELVQRFSDDSASDNSQEISGFEVLKNWVANAHASLMGMTNFVEKREKKDPQFFQVNDMAFFRDDTLEGKPFELAYLKNNRLASTEHYFDISFKKEVHPYGILFSPQTINFNTLGPNHIAKNQVTGLSTDAILAKAKGALTAYISELSPEFYYDVLFHDLVFLINPELEKEDTIISSENYPADEIVRMFRKLAEKFLQDLLK